MSQYAQVQTYISCDRDTFPEVLDIYYTALIEMGCQDSQLLAWLQDIAWPASEDDSFGDIYATGFTLAPDSVPGIVSEGLEVSLYAQAAVPSIEDLPSWVGFNLLFDASTLKSDPVGPYTIATGQTVWRLLQILGSHFTEVGAYFTDEWQENHAWRAIVEDEGEPWSFELAIFPRSLAEYFEMIPSGFKGTVTRQGFGFAQENRWQVLPWLPTSSHE